MKRGFLLLAIPLILGIGARVAGLTANQSFILAIFSLSILGTLLFWDFRLAFVFIGSGILFLASGVSIEQFIKFASLDVIVFLLGMMIVVGMLKESGLFHQLVGLLLNKARLGGLGLFVTLMVLSAVFSAVAGEVTSIIVMVAVIFGICDSLKINPAPLVISSVLTTNVGSAATLLGNPVGILIALRSDLTFEDFLTRALPVSAVVLAITIAILCLWYRRYIKDMSARMAQGAAAGAVGKYEGLSAGSLVNILIFVALILSIALHRRLELLLHFEENRLLVISPIIFAGVAILFRCDSVKYCIRQEVEWKSLLFFMFLFAQAGIIQSSGVSQFLAEAVVKHIGNGPRVLLGTMLFSSGMLSGILDNTVVVSSYIPMVKNLHLMHSSLQPLWWAILFGACFGGNITAIGSTANIVALGLLEKEKKIRVNPFEWLKLGLPLGILSMFVAYLAVAFLPLFSR
jgi:Na+/H+ antiporter NhaD/arsenite permease-like protein